MMPLHHGSTTTVPTGTMTITTGQNRSTVIDQHPNTVAVLRFIHFVLNVICVTIASCDYDVTKEYLRGLDYVQDPENPARKGSRIFFLVVTVMMMIASLALLVCYQVKSSRTNFRNCEMIYYSIGFASLFAAALTLGIIIGRLEVFFFLIINLKAAMGIAFINSGFYLASAILLWKLGGPHL